MKSRGEETKPRYGVTDIERRKYRRFPIRVPVEYYRTDLPVGQTGQTLDASEGGLQILFPEQMEVGQNLRLKLFFSSAAELNAIEMLVEVVWTTPPIGRRRKILSVWGKIYQYLSRTYGQVERFYSEPFIIF